MKDKFAFYKVDVDQLSSVAMMESISAMPTFIIFKDGEKAKTIVGANFPGVKQAVMDAISGNVPAAEAVES